MHVFVVLKGIIELDPQLLSTATSRYGLDLIMQHYYQVTMPSAVIRDLSPVTCLHRYSYQVSTSQFTSMSCTPSLSCMKETVPTQLIHEINLICFVPQPVRVTLLRQPEQSQIRPSQT
jgi:hypothetical protein